MAEPIDESYDRSPFWLRMTDQPTVAAGVGVALVAVACLWLAQGGLSGRLIEIEQQPPREVRFEVDINAADWPELALLPKVGPTLARRIVESRRERGPFASVEDLRRVRGIGAKTLDEIRPFLKPPAQPVAPAGP